MNRGHQNHGRWRLALSVAGLLVGAVYGFHIAVYFNQTDPVFGGLYDGMYLGAPLGGLLGYLLGMLYGAAMDQRRGTRGLQYRLVDLLMAAVAVAVLATLARLYIVPLW